MDPLTLVFNAIVAGAVSATQETASKAIKDGYQALKEIIKSRWERFSLESFEAAPQSESRRAVIKEDLEGVQDALAADRQLLEHAKRLLDLIAKQPPTTLAQAGVDIGMLRAVGELKIDTIMAAQGGVRVGTIEGHNVHVGIIGGEPTRR